AVQPFGGEDCDIEALYFDRDPNYGGNVYIALIASYNPEGSGFPNPPEWVGDMKITLGSDEYGIVMTDHNGLTQGQVYKNPGWIVSEHTGGYYICLGEPYRIDHNHPGALNGNVNTIVFNTTCLQDDYGYGNYVVEFSAPKTAFDSNANSGNLGVTIWCGNDRIDLEGVTFEVPEFTTIAIPVCMILGLFYFFRRKRQNE
ncbi:MAG: PEF-CTERM sorting domain-containing protein, partial [Euryarchaeota archaeon]|nr:PEF-CTERM sorting domain-containing protein [Euryarchaeota archaeon]